MLVADIFMFLTIINEMLLFQSDTVDSPETNLHEIKELVEAISVSFEAQV